MFAGGGPTLVLIKQNQPNLLERALQVLALQVASFALDKTGRQDLQLVHRPLSPPRGWKILLT